MTTDGLDVLLSALAGTGAVVNRIWVEGSSGLGLPVVAALRDRGYDVLEVQASSTNDRRRRRHRAKTRITSAHDIAAEPLADPGLPPPASTTTAPATPGSH